MSDFYIYHAQFESFSNKAIDWFIKSWELDGDDKEIALLHRKRNWEKALKFLEKANKQLI